MSKIGKETGSNSCGMDGRTDKYSNGAAIQNRSAMDETNQIQLLWGDYPARIEGKKGQGWGFFVPSLLACVSEPPKFLKFFSCILFLSHDFVFLPQVERRHWFSILFLTTHLPWFRRAGGSQECRHSVGTQISGLGLRPSQVASIVGVSLIPFPSFSPLDSTQSNSWQKQQFWNENPVKRNPGRKETATKPTSWRNLLQTKWRFFLELVRNLWSHFPGSNLCESDSFSGPECFLRNSCTNLSPRPVTIQIQITKDKVISTIGSGTVALRAQAK